MNASNKPLTGIKVIEMTHMVMGPAVGAILGDLGAEVIKIEPISGDKTRVLKKSGSGYFLTYNRNKRSLAMDIKKEEGKKIVQSLIRKSDVFIENFFINISRFNNILWPEAESNCQNFFKDKRKPIDLL